MKKHFKIRVFDKGELKFEEVVEAKSRRLAITNVLTNKYKGNVEKVTAVEVRLEYIEVETVGEEE